MIQDKQTTHFRKYKEISVLEIKEGSTILKNHGFSYTVESIQTISPNVRLLVLSDSRGNEILEYATLDKNYNVREEQLNEKEDTQKQEKEKVSFDSRGRIGDPNRAVRPRGFPKRELTIGDLQDLVKKESKDDPSPTPLSKGPWDKNPKSIESGQGSWKPLRNASADERAAIAKRLGRPSPAAKKAFKETMRKKFGPDWGRGEVGESFELDEEKEARIARIVKSLTKSVPSDVHNPGRPKTLSAGDIESIKRTKDRKEKLSSTMNEKSAAWQRKEGKNKEGGLNTAGRKSYEQENPGSDLKAPVSREQAAKSKGGKAAKRRKSFCARMGGMRGPMKDEKGKPTRKALSLRKWDCGSLNSSYEHDGDEIAEGKLYDRLVSQLLSRGMPTDKAHATATAQLQKSGSFKSGSRELTKHGKKRQAMGAAGRSKDRAAKRSGKKPSDYKYNPKTNGSSLKEEHERKAK